MTASLAAASSAGVAATLAPAAASARVFSAVRFQTVTSCPRPSSLCAMAAPILPVPAIPILNVSLLAGRASVDTRGAVGSNWRATNIAVEI